MTRHDKSREKGKKFISPCTSHAREAVPRPAVWEVLFGLCCVGGPENANDGAGEMDELGAYVPKLLAH